MKPRLRPIQNLWFRYGQGLNLSAAAMALVLERAGLIELDLSGQRYRETSKALALPNNEFSAVFRRLLANEHLNLKYKSYLNKTNQGEKP